MKENVMFSFLPTTAQIRKTGSSLLIELRNNLNKDNENYETYYNIIWYLTYRLITNENNNFSNEDYSFTEEDYKEFRNIYAKINIEKENLILESILICLKTPNSKILEELNKFSEFVDWYPYGNRIKDNNTNKYIYQKDKIKPIDCYSLLVKIMNKMYQFIHNYSTTITKNFKTPKDSKASLEKYMSDSFYQNMYLAQFDNEFNYLKNFPMFENIYYNVRKQALNFLFYKIRTYYTFDEIEYGFGYNLYNKNELAWQIEKRDKAAARKKRSRR